jgi:hypothetical protein
MTEATNPGGASKQVRQSTERELTADELDEHVSGGRTFRITNARANVSGLGGGGLSGTPIAASIQ